MNLREKLKIGLAIAFVVLFIIDVLDVSSSLIGYQIGLIEINPIGVWFIQQFGQFDGVILAKAISLAVVGLVILYVVKKTPKELLDDEFALGALVGVEIVGVFVLSNNFSLIGLLH